MAQSMQRLSKDDLLKLLDQYADDEDQLVGIIFPCEYTEQLNFYTMKEDKNNG